MSTIVLFVLFPKDQETFKFFFTRREETSSWLLPWQPDLGKLDTSLDGYKRCLDQLGIENEYSCSKVITPSLDYDYDGYHYTIFAIPVNDSLKLKLHELGGNQRFGRFFNLLDIEKIISETKQEGGTGAKPFYAVEVEIIRKFVEEKKRLTLH